MISVDEARGRMIEAVRRLSDEPVGIHQVGPGAVLAEDVLARRDQPPFDASAMDGWAVRFQDLAEPLMMIGESAAGSPFQGRVGPGEAVRIFTGASMPDGADTVVVQEDARLSGAVLQLGGTPKLGANIRLRGQDFQAGEALLRAGQVLRPWSLAVAAAAGVGEVRCSRPPRAALVACGDELVPPGEVAAPHHIYDSVTPALAMRVRGLGGEVSRALLGDSEEALASHIAACEADLIVTVGGASVGDRDFVKPALAALGAALLVDKVAMRPGKPVFFGALPDGRLVLGLPGNPASAMVCAELFLWPILRAMQGADPHRPLERLPLAAPMAANGPREHWLRARLVVDGAVQAFGDQDSSLVSVLAQSDALICRPPGAAAAPAGELAEVLRLEP